MAVRKEALLSSQIQGTQSSLSDLLQRLGIVTEVTGKARDRIWLNRRYVDLLAEGTQPL